MKRTKKRLEEYWDEIVLKIIPSYAKFNSLENEMKEHFNFLGWIIKRFLIPLAFLYIVLGLILGQNLFGSLFLSSMVFLYSNFLPDMDLLIQNTKRKVKESLWYEKYFLLFFAPLALYYSVLGRKKPLYSTQSRYFHNLKSLIVYSIFLLVVGQIFWNEEIKVAMFVLFGVMGFLTHLIVDGIVLGGLNIKKRLEKIHPPKQNKNPESNSDSKTEKEKGRS